eukprot:TRINITY_DN3050_c0_g1_i1.p1 TRINITY_DN3050_c0_g1~~TRINITY_DN3050_c0_g1_i1.p1  ORF type:complete len:697 (-),score=95.98 TRINITY_DN3050_c0_g1_i1:99-2189(-)
MPTQRELIAQLPAPDTGALLENERKKVSFQPEKLQEILWGGADKIATRAKYAKLFDPAVNPVFDASKDLFLSRQEYFRKCVARFYESYRIVRDNADLLAEHSPMHGGGWLSIGSLSNNSSGLGGDHFGLFVGTLLTQSTMEQIREWVPRATKMQIIGCYAQTELGHGSNVRGIETTATFDQATDSFIINSPTLTSLKWWPGALGVCCTHAIIYARLILKGKDYGYHAFMVPLRDEKHQPRPGVIVGDLGPKFGYNYNDSGYCGFRNVRIPRFNMLAKYQSVSKDGEYNKPPRGLSKIGYITMTRTRVAIVRGAGFALARACTIGARYNLVRTQGFKDNKSGTENTILDYQLQAHRILSQLALAYALNFAASDLNRILADFNKKLTAGDSAEAAAALPELHATSAGLKAITTDIAAQGIEEVRKCCGGQGFAMSGGIAKLLLDYTPNVTFEGDRHPMSLQASRYLIQALGSARSGKPVAPAVDYLGGQNQWGDKTCNAKSIADFVSGGEGGRVWVEGFTHAARNAVLIAAQAVENDTQRGKSYNEAWSANQFVLYRACYNHCMLTILRSFLSAVTRITDDSVRKVLYNVCGLFACSQMQAGRVGEWAGYLSASQCRMLDGAVSELLVLLRPQTIGLVDSFGFADINLRSQIGCYDGKVYERIVNWALDSELNDPAYQQSIWKDYLSKHLDAKYLSKL